MLRISVFLLLIGSLVAFRSFSAQEAGTGSHQNGQKASGKARPTSQEIADARAKGLVWVNTATHVYHKEGPLYGTTKLGKFMTEEDAKKAGFRIASETGNHKKYSSAKTQ